MGYFTTGPSGANLSSLVSGYGKGAAVQRPYRMTAWGDSRASFMGTSTILVPTGSTVGYNRNRTAVWLSSYLGDAELVANFGHGGDLATAWADSARPNSKTIANLVAASPFKGGPVDAVYVQYGINDYIGGASGATVAAAIQAVCSTLMGAGYVVILESTHPCTSANYGSGPAAKLQATIDGNALLKTWAAGYPTKLVYVDTFSSLTDGTGYANNTYYADGLHFNFLGGMLTGAACATAVRTLLPAKSGYAFTSGTLLKPNLIGWGDPPALYFTSDQGTVTSNTPTWGYDTALGMPYAEVTMTCTVLTGGRALAHLEVHPASGVISGATPRWAIAVGDELQGSAYITVDDGAGGQAPIQSVLLRQRFYTDSKYSDDGAFIGSASSTFVRSPNGRYTTPTIVSATASGAIAAPSAGAAYCLQAFLEFNTAGQVARLRVYVPSLRVVSQGIQPAQPSAGASPYTYTNQTGSPVMLYVAGGTVSAITLARQGSALTTGFTSGVFYLAQGDSVTVTYTVAPTLTVQPVEQR